MFSMDDQPIEMPDEETPEIEEPVSENEVASPESTDEPVITNETPEIEESISENEVASPEPEEEPESTEETPEAEEESSEEANKESQLPQSSITDEDIADNPFVNTAEAETTETVPVIPEEMLAGLEERVEEKEKEELSDNLFIKAEAKKKADEERAKKAEAKADEEYAVDFNVGDDESDDGRAWYVVHCYSGYENKVRHNLEQRIETMNMKDFIFDVVVPTEEEIEVKEGKRKSVERRVFPGYILVNMTMNEESWYVVRNTPGVTSFVGMGNDPIPLRKEEVSKIIKRMEADAPRIKVTFRQGERVRIVDGPFNDFRGTVDDIDMDKAKVRVMVNFFGRETPVELDFLQVEKA
jgi:transcription termination/antitermination protein NusG